MLSLFFSTATKVPSIMTMANVLPEYNFYLYSLNQQGCVTRITEIKNTALQRDAHPVGQGQGQAQEWRG